MRIRIVLCLAGLLAASAVSRADDAQPPAPKPDAPAAEGKPPRTPKDGGGKDGGGKDAGAKDDGAKDDPSADEPKDETPALTLEQILAGLADTKFVVKRLDAATAAKGVQDPKLIAPLVKVLRDEDSVVRAAAITALGAREGGDECKKAADALCDRLKADSDKPEHDQERRAIAAALHDLAQVGSIGPLLDGIGTGTSIDEIDARCRAVANIESPKAIEGLIGLMAKRHRDGSGLRASCSKALQYATGERLGNDADAWRAWWKDHEKTFDFAAAAARRQADAAAKSAKSAKRNRRQK